MFLTASVFQHILSMPGGGILMVLAIAGTFAATIAVPCTIVVQWRKAREAAYTARLKQMMIERGMTSDEIHRVITSGDGQNEWVRGIIASCGWPKKKSV